MDESTAKAMNVETELTLSSPTEDPALSDATLPLGETGDGGVWKQGAKTWEQERNDAKAANQATQDYLKGKPLKDQKMKAATKLSKVAPRIFASIRQNPPEWLPEFDQFVAQTVGKRPSQTFRHQAANEWDTFVMGALMAFSFFDSALADKKDEDAAADVSDSAPVAHDAGEIPAADERPISDPVPAVEPAAPAVDVGVVEVADDARPSIIVDASGGRSDEFSILGADGQPLIEGLR
jgi:hypothetical protein